MNFKFTKIKTLVSVTISAIVGIYLFITNSKVIVYDAPTPLGLMLVVFLFWFFVAFVPIFIVWSLFEKRGNEPSSNIVGIIIGVLILLALILYFAMKIF